MTRTTVGTQRVRSKIPHRFVALPMPDDITPEFWRLSGEAQNLALRIAWMQGRGIRVVERDWEQDLLRTLCVHGRARGNATRQLRAIVAAGLIQIEDGELSISLRPREAAGDVPLDVHRTSVELPSNFRFDLNHRNDSTPISQIREDKIILREERAREEHVPFQSEPQSEPDIPFHSGPPTAYAEGSTHRQLRVGFEQRFRDAEGVIPNQRLLSKAMPDAVKFCDQKAAHLGKPVEEVIKRLLDGFFADGRAHAEHYPPAFLATNPGQYFEPRVAAAKGGGVTLATTLRAELAKLNEQWRLGNSTPPSHPDRQKLMREIRALAAKIDLVEGKVAA